MRTARDGPATQGFQRQGPGAGKEIDGDLAFDCVAEKIEEGLSNPVLHGPGAQIARILQFPPAKLASNDPHAHGTCRCRSADDGETCLSAVSFVLPSDGASMPNLLHMVRYGRGTDSGDGQYSSCRE